MHDADPHIHVNVKFRSDIAVRNLLASTFGLVGDSPATVTTGCGQRVPLAMTSGQPERVTCLPCREFAHGQHLRLAEQLDGLAHLPGLAVTDDGVARAAAWHRDLARRFAA